MANQYDNIYQSQPLSTYVPLPLNLMAQGLAMKQEGYDKSEQEKTDILGKTWNRLPGDAKDSQQLKQKIDSTLSEFSNKDWMDPQVKADWYRTKSQLVNEFGSNGTVGAQQANYDAYNAYAKSLLSQQKELGWSTEELQSHLNQAKNSFKTINNDGSINNFQGQGLASYVDPNEWASKALKDVASDTGIEKLKDYKSLNQVTEAFRSGELEHKDYSKIMNALALRAKGDSKLNASLEQEGKFKGQTGWSNFIQGLNDKGDVVPNVNTPFGKILSGVSMGAQYQKEKQEYMQVNDALKLKQLSEQQDNKTKTYETALSQMGQKGVADLSDIAKNEPTNSILSSIINFASPSNQAKALLNIYKLMVPMSQYNPDIINRENALSKQSNMSQDKLDEHINYIGYSIKQQMGADQKSFRDKFGFNNPVIEQSYNIVDAFTGHKTNAETDEYKRSKEIVSAQIPGFDKMSQEDQYNVVKKAQSDFVQSSKLNNVIVSTDGKEVARRNNQLINVTGTPEEQTKQLMNLGVAANGVFIDAQTQNQVPLKDVVKSGQLKYIGQLDNKNQSGPAMDYYQSADGHFYLSPGALEDRKNNYIDWSLNQADNRFSQKFETPLMFDDSRDSRNFKQDGVTPIDGISKLSVEKNKDKTINVSIHINNKTFNAPNASSTEEAKKLIGIQMIKNGDYTADQVLNLGL